MLRLAGENPLQLLELAALDVLELESDALGRLGLLVVDLLLKLPLAPAEALGDLVQGAPALGAVGLELGREGGRHILRRRGRGPRASWRSGSGAPRASPRAASVAESILASIAATSCCWR